jgi:hypothetical protein
MLFAELCAEPTLRINIALRSMEHRVKEYTAQFTSTVPPCAGISNLLGREEYTILGAIRQEPSLVLSPSIRIFK